MHSTQETLKKIKYLDLEIFLLVSEQELMTAYDFLLANGKPLLRGPLTPLASVPRFAPVPTNFTDI